MNPIISQKVKKAARAKIESMAGSILFDLNHTLSAMALRPFELHLELTNICNANCIFCCYQFQERPQITMSDSVFYKSLQDFVVIAGGSVGLTPLVGDALIDPQFLTRVKFIRSLPQIDRIFVTTNGILLDKFGITEILTSGLTSIDISTSGFEEESYRRIYRSAMYMRMKENVTNLVKENERLGSPVNISIGIRTDRPMEHVMKDHDFQPILEFKPYVDYVHFFSTAGGRIKSQLISPTMRLRAPRSKRECCANLYNGPIVSPNGDVLACCCFDAMDAITDLKIGNIMEDSLGNIYAGRIMKELRGQFSKCGTVNKTCTNCDSYQGLDLYRTKEGRLRAELNRQRYAGKVVNRKDKAKGISLGG